MKIIKMDIMDSGLEDRRWMELADDSGVPREGRLGGFKPPLEIPQGPPKSCQTQPDCENC